MNRLSRNISANLLSNVWSTVLLLLLTPVYVGFLGVEGYGLIGFYTSWVAILGVLDTGISATAVREIAWLSARPEEKRKIPVLLRSLEVFYWGGMLVLGLGIFAGAWFLGEEWFQAKNLPPVLVRESLVLMTISLVVQVPSGLYGGGLIGLQHQVVFSVLVAFWGAVRGVGAVLVLWKIGPDIRAFFVWQIVVSALQTGVLRKVLWTKVRSYGSPAEFSMEVLKSAKGFAGGMSLISAVGILIAQADKIILSRVVSLETFGFYMLAWSVASGLSRVSTPLIQAFGPYFTELVSLGDDATLVRRTRLASQLMNTLILPPAAFIVLLAKPILSIWLENQVMAAGAAPVLAVMTLGMAFVSCAYPALSLLYSRGQLRLVLVVNLVSLVILLPLILVMVVRFGVMGAAFCWLLYGVILYFVYQWLGLLWLPDAVVFSSILKDFVAPCLTSFAVAGMALFWLNEEAGRGVFFIQLGLGLIIGWVFALAVCQDLFIFFPRGNLSDKSRSSVG